MHNTAVLFGASLVIVTLAACPASSVGLCDDGACSAVGDGGPGADGDGGGVQVDPCIDHPEAAECLTEESALFVSGAGDNNGDGTKTKPYKTLEAALGKIGADKKRIYVCEGNYPEDVVLDANHSGVSVFGGFSCDWKASDAKPKFGKSTLALKITEASGVALSSLAFEAKNATEPGGSSIAAFVSAGEATFRNVTLTAGDGAAGAKGTVNSNYTGAVATAGGNSNGGTPGTGPVCTCMDKHSSTGGNGGPGDGTALPGSGSSVPSVGDENGGSSGTGSCGVGTTGANGFANGAGSPSSSPGVLSASGWASATEATKAPNGNPGQGGGGGGAKTTGNNGGGGGGCGGCGGGGGGRGANGGSSFALLSFNSRLTVQGGALQTKTGGRGGDGEDGQDGQAGGGGGGGACNGGAGGDGAGGSGGGGGAGGHSIPFAFVGDSPNVSAETKPGTKGAGGSGGAAGLGPGNPGAEGKPGPEGKAQDSLAL